MIYTISNGKYQAIIDSLGAELISVKTENGFEAMWQSGGDYWKSHAPLLFPICGRIKNGKYTLCGKEYEMATHGFLRKSEFALAEKTESKLTLVKKSDENTLKEYPFDFVFTAEYSVCDDGVHADFKIENKTDKPMPYMFGWHPGFAFPRGAKRLEDFTLDFGECESVDYNPLMNSVFVNPNSEKIMTPRGEYKIDSEFLYKTDTIILSGMNNFAKFKKDDGSFALTLSWSDNLPYLCLWKYPDDAARYICLEPWSSLPGNGDDDENFDTRKMRRMSPMSEECFNYTISIDN